MNLFINISMELSQNDYVFHVVYGLNILVKWRSVIVTKSSP